MEKTLFDFLNKYFGIANVGDTDQNKGQCVGLIEVFLDTLNINDPHLWGNAKDLLANADPAKFEKITNDPNDYNQFPPIGAVIVFGPSWGNGLGHCGIVLRANGSTFSLFNANNPEGSRPTITNFPNYGGVLGWFYAK